ncbi:hypothetical protein H2200_002162 [Cladophialophora chaetospira]|uniref:Uncharacterized protein n=1 Tax=Cladophialophora chaetospira TaxID=386627 RepID=A0AA38XIG3_9EURO|nr:hypothetical protein H2200_002162 [Cladophialophora chaetospira]
MSQRTNVDNKLPKQGSMKSQIKKATKAQIGTDLGKLPQTFVLPPSSELPSWTKLKRAKIHWLQLKNSFKDFWSLILFLKWEPKRHPLTRKHTRKPLELDNRIGIAKDLHLQFHKSLGAGDMKALQTICCEGLLKTSRTRIEQRKALRRTTEYWQLLSYTGVNYPTWLNRWPLSGFLPNAATKVVADRLAPLPFADTYIRQCTVRIRSVQDYMLANMDKSTILKHTDYVVLQKMSSKGEEGPWKLWGITEPTTIEEMDAMLSGKSQDAGTTLSDRIRDKISSLSPV